MKRMQLMTTDAETQQCHPHEAVVGMQPDEVAAVPLDQPEISGDTAKATSKSRSSSSPVSNLFFSMMYQHRKVSCMLWFFGSLTKHVPNT